MKPSNKSGISLIEMVAVIVVLGLSIPVLLNMWADVAWRSGRAEAMANATFYAQQLMEEVKSKRFDEKTDPPPPWTSSANFGVDAGENSNDSATFDDVDDFVGCADSDVTTPGTGYSRSVSIDYVRLNGTTWQTCGATICVNSTTCANCDACCYKRIRVSVSHRLASDVSLVTMVRAP